MHLDVTWYTQQSAVVHVVGQPLHLLNGAAGLHGHNVMAVNARRYDALLHALLAQSVGASPHLYLHASIPTPPAVVQQSLITFIAAHTVTMSM